jgi:hypothetical protein
MFRRRKQRRSAAVVLWTLALLIVAQAAWLLLGNRPQTRDIEYGARLKHLQHRLREAPDRPLVLALGSSRLLNGLAADYLPGNAKDGSSGPLVFNMGITGAGPLTELITLRRVLADGIRPRAVLIEVLPRPLYPFADPQQMQEPVTAPRRSWQDRDVLPAGEEWHCCLDWLTPPWSELRCVLMKHLAPHWVPRGSRPDLYQTTGFGWSPPTPGPTAPPRSELLRRNQEEYAAYLRFSKINHRADQLFHLLLEECRRHDIEVLALVSMPEASEFRSWYQPGAREVMVHYLTGLCAEHDTHYIDAGTWLPDDAFYDGHHLLRTGAAAFSARLWQEVLRPWAERNEHGLR